MAFNTPIYVKPPNSKSYFDAAKAKELMKCAQDPIYFSENYVMIQHPVKGNIPFRLYGFQKNLINAFSGNRYVVALTARQMGKSLQANTIITYDGNKVNISSLIPMTFREKIVTYLENLLLKLSK